MATPENPESTQAAPPAIPEGPPRIPTGMPASPSADHWSSADSPAKILEEDKEPVFSAQSQQVIDAIKEGLHDDLCTQIDGYGPSKLSAQFDGDHHIMEGLAFSSAEEYEMWLKQMVDNSGSIVTWEQIEEQRRGVLNLIGGGRLTIIMPPIANGISPTFSLRKHVATKWEAVAFVDNETMSQTMLNFLRTAVAARVNILFVGQIGSGKTTLLRALAQGFGDDEKIAVVEQVPELAIKKPLVVEYTYQPDSEGLGLADVLDDQLYNGVDRLIVGEVHLEGITKMLETMIVTEGSMSTYHAFSTEQAGERMKLALQIENQNVTSHTALSFIKQAVELVVVLERVDGKRRVTQITELDWRSSGGKESLGGSDLFVYDRERGQFRTTGSPPDPNGRVRFKVEKYGIPINDNWFIDQEKLARLQQAAQER